MSAIPSHKLTSICTGMVVFSGSRPGSGLAPSSAAAALSAGAPSVNVAGTAALQQARTANHGP